LTILRRSSGLGSLPPSNSEVSVESHTLRVGEAHADKRHDENPTGAVSILFAKRPDAPRFFWSLSTGPDTRNPTGPAPANEPVAVWSIKASEGSLRSRPTQRSRPRCPFTRPATRAAIATPRPGLDMSGGRDLPQPESAQKFISPPAGFGRNPTAQSRDCRPCHLCPLVLVAVPAVRLVEPAWLTRAHGHAT
jgi:hypothetical protein